MSRPSAHCAPTIQCALAIDSNGSRASNSRLGHSPLGAPFQKINASRNQHTQSNDTKQYQKEWIARRKEEKQQAHTEKQTRDQSRRVQRADVQANDLHDNDAQSDHEHAQRLQHNCRILCV